MEDTGSRSDGGRQQARRRVPGRPAGVAPLFRAVERPIATGLQDIVQSSHFSGALSYVLAAKVFLESTAERISRGGLHGINLPSASDIQALTILMKELDRCVSENMAVILTRLESLEQAQAGRAGQAVPASTPGSDGRAGRTKRPAANRGVAERSVRRRASS